MKKQVGVIVWQSGMNIENFKQSYIDRFTNVDSERKAPLKITFDEYEEEGNRWIEVWGEE
jgi:hypothetical protein